MLAATAHLVPLRTPRLVGLLSWIYSATGCSYVVGTGGVEPPTSSLSVMRSNRLSYAPRGTATPTRTKKHQGSSLTASYLVRWHIFILLVAVCLHYSALSRTSLHWGRPRSRCFSTHRKKPGAGP
jgi:hypothetical protein